MTQSQVGPHTYSVHFWLLCTSSLMFFASFNMIIPELPSYLTSLGGAEYKGLIISLFTITAMLSRPFSGKLVDSVGRVPIMMAGSIVCFICSAIYPILTGVIGFFLLRLIHGFSTGFTPTGQTTYLSDLVPAKRRGEAMGFLGTAGTIGMAGGPALGGAITNQVSLEAMFYCSSFFALSSILILIGIKETLTTKKKFSRSMLKISKEDIFEPRVLTPCLVMVLCAFSFGAVYTVIPDFGEFVGVKNKGLLFTYFTVASLFVRFLGGKASDYYGRAQVLKISTVILTVAMLIVGTAQTSFVLIVGVSMYGLAHGITSPTLLAWASDLSDENRRGRGLASIYIFMEMGIGLGAFISGFIYGNDPGNFIFTFSACSLLSLSAFVYLVFGRIPISIQS
ncbi:MAG TPA: MFS transporter [Cytophagales bacterium]|nr:MFS transporter [Cytophagales bacterium]HCR54699.1 MFS transporter [Cytophagales bacterium]